MGFLNYVPMLLQRVDAYADAWAPMIYVVDDDDAVRDSLRTLLTTFGFPVKDFASGQEFFARADRSEGKCLILDVNLPGESGLEVLARLRADGSTLPVVMLSGRAEASARRRARELGAAAFLDKPVAFDVLRATIRAVVDAADGKA